ncbi:hypothetical protein AAFF_G00203700, partial [Aldrovandia affinis]
ELINAAGGQISSHNTTQEPENSFKEPVCEWDTEQHTTVMNCFCCRFFNGQRGTRGHPTEEGRMLKDCNANGAAISEKPPTPSAENHKQRKHKIKIPKFKIGPRSPKANINTVDAPPPAELSFKENVEEGRLSEAGRQLIAREERLFQRGEDQEVAEVEGREKEEDELNGDYETLLVQVWLAVQRSLSAAPGEVEALRSAVSTIVQEEAQDGRWREVEEAPVWRPQRCRHTHDNLLRKLVEQRMDGTEEDASAAEKLSTSLKREVCNMGKRAQADLLKVVREVRACYPAEFDVCNTYARLYHQAFSDRLAKIAKSELDFNDLVYLLCWVYNYYPHDILKHKELEKNIDCEALGPLLPESVVRPLEEKYLSNKENQVKVWVSNALRKEEDSWRSGPLPELISDYYFSNIAIDVIQMIDGAMRETTAVFSNESRCQRIVCQLEIFLMSYKKSLEEFMKGKGVNIKAVLKANLVSIEQFKEHIVKFGDLLPEEKKTRCRSLLEDMEDCAYRYFLDIMRADLKAQYKQLWTPAWLTGGTCELEEQIKGHIQDCGDMKSTCRKELVGRLHVQVMAEYVKRMMKGKVKLKDRELQETAVPQLREDNERLNVIFTEEGSGEKWLQEILPKIAEVLRLQDLGALQLEVITLALSYPDLTDRHISALLHLKTNLSNSDIKRIKESLTANRDLEISQNARSFFSRVPIKWTAKIM